MSESAGTLGGVPAVCIQDEPLDGQPASAQASASAHASKSSKPASAQASASARADKRKRSDSITSVSAGESSDEEPDANFGTRAPVHWSLCWHLLPPDIPENQCIEQGQYDDLLEATQQGDHEAVRKIHEGLRRPWRVLDS